MNFPIFLPKKPPEIGVSWQGLIQPSKFGVIYVQFEKFVRTKHKAAPTKRLKIEAFDWCGVDRIITRAFYWCGLEQGEKRLQTSSFENIINPVRAPTSILIEASVIFDEGGEGGTRVLGALYVSPNCT